MFKYNGLKITIKEVTTFNCYVTIYKHVLIIYMNKNLSNRDKSRILHKAIKQATNYVV